MMQNSLNSGDFLQAQSVAVIGASGFIGSHLIDSLLEQGCHIKAISRNLPGLISPTALDNSFFSSHSVDISDYELLHELLCGVDIVIHLACSTVPKQSNLDPKLDVEVNLIGSLNILKACVARNIKRLIFISSGGTVYGTPESIPIDESHPTNPSCSYGITKLAIEKYISLYRDLYGLSGVILRLANPYGERQRLQSGQGVVPTFLYKAITRQTLEVWGDGSTVRDFLYISDVVEAIKSACDCDDSQFIFNIGSGQGTSINQLISVIQDITGLELCVDYKSSRLFDVPANVLSIDKAYKYLNWSPLVCSKDGIARFYKYLCDCYRV